MYRIYLIILLSIYSFAHSYRGDDTHTLQMINKSLNSTYDDTISFQKILPKTLGGEYNTILTEHFRIYYGNSNPGSTLWNDVDKNGVADYLDLLKVELEVIWDKEVEEFGFNSPNYGDYIDIFVSDTGIILDGSSLNMGDNVVGWSVYDENNGETYMVVNGGIGYYQGTSGSDLLKITLAHEFFHLCQYSYAHENGDFYDKNIWLYEGTAVWMEYQVYPNIDDYMKTYGDYIASVLTKGIVEESGIYPYAMNYFFDFLNNISSNPNFIKTVWEKFAQTSDAIKALEEALALENKNLYNLLVSYAKTLQTKQESYYTNGKVLFEKIDTSVLVSEYSCNSGKSKTMGYYSVILFDDMDVSDDCGVFEVNSGINEILFNDGETTLDGKLLNLKKGVTGGVVIPKNTISTNNSLSMKFKMLENTSIDVIKGWNLVGANSDIALNSIDSSKINTIWSYDNGWKLFSSQVDNYGLEKLDTIKSGKGFWINANESSQFIGKSFDKSVVCDFESLKDGWNLVSNRCVSQLNLDDTMQKYSIKNAWKFDGGKWFLRELNWVEDYGFDTFTTVDSHVGYWFFK